MSYSTDVGHGICVKERAAEGIRPKGFIVEIHFYQKADAVKYAAGLIRREASMILDLGVDLDVCRKDQGKAEPGNSCLQTPGTCESCPKWVKG